MRWQIVRRSGSETAGHCRMEMRECRFRVRQRSQNRCSKWWWTSPGQTWFSCAEGCYCFALFCVKWLIKVEVASVSIIIIDLLIKVCLNELLIKKSLKFLQLGPRSMLFKGYPSKPDWVAFSIRFCFTVFQKSWESKWTPTTRAIAIPTQR